MKKMTSYEVAKFLNEDCTDDEFTEVFAYLYVGMNGRGIPEELTPSMIKDFEGHSEQLFKALAQALEVANNGKDCR